MSSIQIRRLSAMGANNIKFSIPSLNALAVQAIIDKSKAAVVAAKANDRPAEHIQRRPDRFSGFAALLNQDSEHAIKELQRSVHDMGLKGALVNVFTHDGNETDLIYYSDPRIRAFWACVQELDVPC